jgi:hypothetical protein
MDGTPRPNWSSSAHGPDFQHYATPTPVFSGCVTTAARRESKTGKFRDPAALSKSGGGVGRSGVVDQRRALRLAFMACMAFMTVRPLRMVRKVVREVVHGSCGLAYCMNLSAAVTTAQGYRWIRRVWDNPVTTAQGGKHIDSHNPVQVFASWCWQAVGCVVSPPPDKGLCLQTEFPP